VVKRASTRGYQPTAADMEFRNSAKTTNPFERARLMRSISHEYLAVLAHDNASPNSAATKAMIDTEISRRGFAAARNANRIAIGSLIVAGISLLVSILI
jgi:hypothetical protein